VAEPLLRVEGLTVERAGGALLQGVSFQVEPACLTAVIGPDDADKDVLVDALTGRRACRLGTLRLEGRPITRTAPAARVRAGLVTTMRPPLAPSSTPLVESVAVAMAGRRPLRAPWWRRRASPAQARAAGELLRFVGLPSEPPPAGADHDAEAAARLTLACALALQPRLLIVDRLTRGLEPAARHALARLLARLAAGGIGVLWLEDDVELVGDEAGFGFVLARGRLVAAGSIEVLAGSRVAEAAFLGEGS
jgi:ABC-type branched-subunit amino acid transport system ATPase component